MLWGTFVWQANCERWCPFGGVEAIDSYAAEGDMLCSLGTSNFFILGGVVLMTLLLRRAFCGYVCPIGTLSEWLHGLGRRWGLPEIRVAGKWDRLLSLSKYAVLAIVLWLTWRAGELVFRGFDPCYALDQSPRDGHHAVGVRRVGCDRGGVAAGELPFCRWLCPFAAVLNPFSRFGLTRIRRHAESCRECGRVRESCPVAIPVDQLDQVQAARCLSCLNCIAACPRTAAAGAVLGTTVLVGTGVVAGGVDHDPARLCFRGGGGFVSVPPAVLRENTRCQAGASGGGAAEDRADSPAAAARTCWSTFWTGTICIASPAT